MHGRMVILALALISQNAFADAPALIPITGLLTDAEDVPLEGEFSLQLALYGSETSSAALYRETQVVAVSAGGFSVMLGEAGVLDLEVVRGRSELWLGITVESDPELSPRIRIGTVPYAAFAQYCGDATTLEGASASDFAPIDHTHDPYSAGSGLTLNGNEFSLDQSTVESYARAVCIDTNAEAQAAMGARANNNPYNHDRYTNAEAVGAMGAIGNNNPLNHNRYTNAEAVGAMGALANNNPLNHNRYTDAEAVAAMGTLGNNNPRNHNRYTNAEAVGAMGALANNNPLNHNRYTDAEAVAAVSAADQYVRNTTDTMTGNFTLQGSLRIGTGNGGSLISQVGPNVNCPSGSIVLARNWNSTLCVGTGGCASSCTTPSGWMIGPTVPTCNYTFGDIACFQGVCSATTWTETVCIGD